MWVHDLWPLFYFPQEPRVFFWGHLSAHYYLHRALLTSLNTLSLLLAFCPSFVNWVVDVLFLWEKNMDPIGQGSEQVSTVHVLWGNKQTVISLVIENTFKFYISLTWNANWINSLIVNIIMFLHIHQSVEKRLQCIKKKIKKINECCYLAILDIPLLFILQINGLEIFVFRRTCRYRLYFYSVINRQDKPVPNFCFCVHMCVSARARVFVVLSCDLVKE